MPFLGGITITDARWLFAGELLLTFRSEYSDRGYQLYAGRRLIAVEPDPTARRIVGLLDPSHYPAHLRLLACALDEIDQDWGDDLPPRPLHVARLVVSTAGYPSDAAHLDLTVGTAPGGAVDADNLHRRVLLDGIATSHTIDSEPLGPAGTWNLELTPYDDKPDGGNAGTPLESIADVLPHPPDFLTGNRFAAAAAAGTLTVNCTVPAD